jgi:ATP-dependent DNA helicase DinG
MAGRNPIELLDATVAGLGGERRDGQHELADAVVDALRGGHHLVAEAPTGSGKSLAYLAPAIASGRKVVVATSTIALQSQLVDRDLPAIREHGGLEFSFALLKGRANYVCLTKLRAAGRPDALFETPVGAGFDAQLERLEKFAKTSETGDRSELDDAVPDTAWAAVSCTSMECPGRNQCGDGEECFAELARDRARDADVLVVNHALYAVHLAAGANVLPDHDAVILDEAHAFPDNATSNFGADLAPVSISRLATMLEKAGVKNVDVLQRAANGLTKVVESREGRLDVGSDEQLVTGLTACAEAIVAARKAVGTTPTDEHKRTVQLADARIEVLRRLAAPYDGDVVWVEKFGNSTRLKIAPVDVGGAIGARLLEQKPVIAVSATLGGEPPFGRFAMKMGFVSDAAPGTWGEENSDGERIPRTGRGYARLRASSSFDWREQGLLYVARDLPDPRHAKWEEAAGARAVALVDAAGGRALVLCTSRKNVDTFAKLLRERTEHRVLAQGDADVGQLTRTFAADETSVLVGTRSFWQGIDAPGVACVLVVIDKIPFPMVSDPLMSARKERARDAGLSDFGTVDLPEAALVLAQGAGRLIRRIGDKGVVAVLDARLATKDYRTQLLAGLPPFKRSVTLSEACDFLEHAAANVEKVAGAAVPDVTVADSVDAREARACPKCGAAVGERCHDANGTMAFVHQARRDG